jgi:DNA-binding transcriptional regulator YiaG
MKRTEQKSMNAEAQYVEYQVHIPNLEGDAVAEIVPIQIPVTIDANTGEELLTEAAIKLIEDTKARYMGLLLPGEIRELRLRLGLTQKQMSELIQAGEKSYTRWETGYARPSRMVNVLLRLLYEGKVSVEDLLSVQKSKPECMEAAR